MNRNQFVASRINFKCAILSIVQSKFFVSVIEKNPMELISLIKSDEYNRFLCIIHKNIAYFPFIKSFIQIINKITIQKVHQVTYKVDNMNNLRGGDEGLGETSAKQLCVLFFIYAKLTVLLCLVRTFRRFRSIFREKGFLNLIKV